METLTVSQTSAERLKMQALLDRMARAERDLEEGNFADGESFMRRLIDRERG